MPALCQNGLHVTCAIKEEEKVEERVGNLESKRENVEKLKVKKRNKRGGSEVFGFLVFHFLSKGSSREDNVTGEGGFPFC